MNAHRCPHCGGHHREGARYCGVTGQLIDQSSVVTPGGPAVADEARPGTDGRTGLLQPANVLHGRYRILSKVGQGGMGAVYCVEDAHAPGQRWALKELSNAVVEPDERRQAEALFTREASMLRSLAHPNLPRVVDSFEEAGRHYIVMDFIDGASLGQMLRKRDRPFGEDEVVRWAGQLCGALDYLHGRTPPIIFRDLKPDNIMLDGLGRIYLIDFGIARHFAPGKAADTRQLGTLGYAPPEQYGHGQTDPLSDVYSLGVTLQHLLTGQAPPRIGALPDVAALRPDLSPSATAAIRRATRAVRDERWPSAGALYQGLTRDGGRTPGPPPAAPAPGPPIARGPTPGQPSTRIDAGGSPTQHLTAYLRRVTTDWTTTQLAGALLGLTVVGILAVGTLAPLVRDRLPLLWFNFPGYALPILALHAATRTRRVTFAAAGHGLVTGASWLAGNLVLGEPMSIVRLVLALVVSGAAALAVVEIPARSGAQGGGAAQPWQQRALLSAAAGALTAATFIPAYYGTFTVGPIVGGVVAGAVGWFVGDLVYQWRVGAAVAGP